MTQITYYVAASLDGYIAGPEHQLDWLPVPDPQGEDYGYRDFESSVDAVVMGRASFDVARSFGDDKWPYADKPLWICTRSGSANTTGLPGEIHVTEQSPQALKQLWAERGFKHVWMMGGGQVAARFLAAGALDTLILTQVPILLGRGIPLFAPTASKQALQLYGTERFEDGLVQLRYNLVKR